METKRERLIEDEMEEFRGQGVSPAGFVQSYDKSSALFEIVYRDGDSDFSSLLNHAVGGDGSHHHPFTRVVRKPKKRRRLDTDQGPSNSTSSIRVFEDRNNGAFDLNLDLNEGFDLNEGAGEVEVGAVGGGVDGYKGDLEGRGCIDLNLDLNGEEEVGGDLMGFGGDDGGREARKKECGFDLNLEVTEVMKDDDEVPGDCGGKEKENGVGAAEVAVLNVESGGGEVFANGALVDVHVFDGSHVGLVGGGICREGFGACVFVEVLGNGGVKEEYGGVVDGSQGVRSGYRGRGRLRGRKKRVEDSVSAVEMTVLVDADAVKDDGTVVVIDENKGEMGNGRRGRGRPRGSKNQREDSVSAPEMSVLVEANAVKDESTDVVIDENQDEMGSGRIEGSGRRRGRRKLAGNSNSATVVNDVNADKHALTNGVIEGNLAENGSACKEVCGSLRKRRKISDYVTSTPETTALRRSTRRGAVRDKALASTPILHDDLSLSPAVSALTEEKPTKSCRQQSGEPLVLPPKVVLPPSSQSPDLNGLPVIDVFSIYACLRSFSMLLFLSPFEFEDFVEALKSDSPTFLLDCIHVSILQTLKKHLVYLSNEGSESASDCLRSLNWAFLDVITWPVFMVEYFVIHGSGLKPEFDLCRFKLLRSDYYKQPVFVKVEILRCLCDDMIEVEAIRSELNRRSSGAESESGFDRHASLGTYKKRRAGMDMCGASCLTEEAAEDTTDWNSDECCLCKMDGNLICCDGCPAAYHSKCVGVANDSLPDGDWYCPECSIDRHKPWMKTRNSLRGAELLGVDPYGRLYFSSCGYLLVSDSSDPEKSFSYYNINDLNSIVEVLKTSVIYYGSILESICKHWAIPVSLYGASNNLNRNYTVCMEMCMSQAELASAEICTISNLTVDRQELEGKLIAGCSYQHDVEVLNSVSPACLSSEGSAETTQMSSGNQGSLKDWPGCSNRSADISNQSELLGTCPFQADNSLTLTSSDVKLENNIESSASGCDLSAVNTTNGGLEKVLPGSCYVNYYSFGHTAALAVEELTRKPNDKIVEVSIKSDEEIISAQMKVISKVFSRFYWPNLLNMHADMQKEKCGWCFYCRVPTDDSDCLFNLSLGPTKEGYFDEVAELQTTSHSNGHLKDVMCGMLLLEDRLQGLLLGPWLGPHYSRLWRKSILKASDLESVKSLLLNLELNLHHLALSAEWWKHMDSAVTMGSASHVMINSSRASVRNGIGRKRVRYSESESNPSSNSTGGLSMLWWRGGRLSRQLFSWKVLPHSLVSKAARQAGSLKIPGVVYPENSDPAKRSKCAAWRAAVESSATVEQLALQVRDLDSNIRWNEIENTHAMSILDKEFKKSIRHFKKAIIRRKCKEGEGTKYLLDFGKRKIIPEVVSKNGSFIKESLSERKKYWLNESYVPLHLLKTFEEKRISRKSGKINVGKVSEANKVKMPSKKRGFSYLFAKAERSEYHQCGHCNKDVPIRDAVCCQHCKGSFHKRHVRRSGGSVTSKCVYTCHRCSVGKCVKADTKKGKIGIKKGKSHAKKETTKSKRTGMLHQKSGKVSAGRRSVRLSSKRATRALRQLRSRYKKKVNVVAPLRRSARKAKSNLMQMQNEKVEEPKKGSDLLQMQNKNVEEPKKGKQVKTSKRMPQKRKNDTLWHKKRSLAHHSYWLNGLQLSRKPDDERVKHFRRKGFLGPSDSFIPDQPKCHLCCGGYTSSSSYISCEICGEWFNGDPFGLTSENMNRLIGFRCHVCRKSNSPLCQCLSAIRSNELGMEDAQNDDGIGISLEANNDFLRPNEINPLQESVSNEDHQGLESVSNEDHQGLESVSNEDHQGLLPLDESHGEGQIDAALRTDHTLASDCKLKEENEHILVNVIDDTEKISISTQTLEPDLQTSCNEKCTLEENETTSGDVLVTSCPGLKSPSCKIDGDVVGSEIATLGRTGANDGLTTPV